MVSIKQIEQMTAEINSRLSDIRAADPAAAKRDAFRELLDAVERGLFLATKAGLAVDMRQVAVHWVGEPQSQMIWEVHATRHEFIK